MTVICAECAEELEYYQAEVDGQQYLCIKPHVCKEAEDEES